MVGCQHCTRQFKNKASLRTHLHNYHLKRGTKPKRIEHPGKSNYKCGKCGKTFTALSKLYQHKKEHGPVVALVNHSTRHYPHYSDISDADEPYQSSVSGISDAETVRPHYSDISDAEPPYSDISDPERLYSDISDPDSEHEPVKPKLPPSKKRRVDSSGAKHFRKYRTLYRNCLREMARWKGKFQKKDDECNIELDKKDLEIEEMKDNYEEQELLLHNKIMMLNAQIENLMSKEPSEFNAVSKALFNCVTIPEINRLRKLFKHRQIDEILKDDSIEIIQKLLIGLTNGVIPICNPQRTAITDDQRDLIDNIEDASIHDAKELIQSNLDSIIKLFSVVGSSVKLVVDMYNRYGSLDEDESDESSDDNESAEDSDDGSSL